MPSPMEWGQRRYESANYGRSSAGISFVGLGLGDFSRGFSMGQGGGNEGGIGPFSAPEIFPTVVIQPGTNAARIFDQEDSSDGTVVYGEGVINPEAAVSSTVFESYPVPQEIAYIPEYRIPPRSVLDPIPVFVDTGVNTEPVSAGVAIDWGDIAGGIIGGIWGDSGTSSAGYSGPSQIYPTYQPPAPGMRTTPPAKVTVDTRTGAVTTCRRRRRRRLLTSSDLADLASLKAIVGGGAAMNAAVVKAVRR